ncbi:hypothetical protein [Mesorhizobium sp. M1252]|uniref:hypothetical protein n=1 Tax=Mesorhizobium sp. M1252 TaxID=2957073 RepID=UPI00333DEEE4
MRAADNLYSFAKKIRDGLKSAKTPPTAVDGYARPSPVLKTLERLSKISIEQESPFGAKYHRNEKGAETVEFTYQPSESAEIRKNLKLEREIRKETMQASRAIIHRAPDLLEPPASDDAQTARSFRVPALGADQSESAVLGWINILKGLGYEGILPSIAADFEGQGNFEVARIIRTQIRTDDRGTERVTE